MPPATHRLSIIRFSNDHDKSLCPTLPACRYRHWLLAVLSVFSGNLSAQNPSQSVNQAELTRGQIQPPFAPAISPTGVEDGYAAASPSDADLGEQRILKQVEEYKAFSLLIASSFILRAGPSVHTSRERSARTAIRRWFGALLY